MKETTQNNILLARFLGWKEQTDPTERWFGTFKTLEGIIHKNTDAEPLLFHTSWDWLIPVVEKIESLLPDDSVVNIAYKDCYIPVIEGEFTIETNGSTKIEAVYYACVEFVKFYNNKRI